MNLSIKCGNCINHVSIDIGRSRFENELTIADSINKNAHKFTAEQRFSDVIFIKCTECKYEERLNI